MQPVTFFVETKIVSSLCQDFGYTFEQLTKEEKLFMLTALSCFIGAEPDDGSNTQIGMETVLAFLDSGQSISDRVYQALILLEGESEGALLQMIAAITHQLINNRYKAA